jgi:hypothetical protein
MDCIFFFFDCLVGQMPAGSLKLAGFNISLLSGKKRYMRFNLKNKLFWASNFVKKLNRNR